MTPLKFYRILKGMTVSALALKVGLSISMLSKMEKGITLGSKETRMRVANALGIAEKNLFGGK